MSSTNIYIKQIQDISLKNKYTKWYCNIIAHALERASTRKQAKSLLGYVEGHHILPKSFNMGGDKDESNIVYLTAREHLIVHWMSFKMFSNELFRKSMQRAFHSMTFQTNGGKNQRKFIRHHARAREAMSSANAGRVKISYGVPDSLRHLSIDEFKLILQNYCDEDLSCVAIGKELNLTAACIHGWLKKYNISRRRILRNKDLLLQKLIEHNFNTYAVGRELKVSGEAVMWYMDKFQIQRP